MGKPIQLKIHFDGLHVSAKVLPEMTVETYKQVVCKTCAPKKSRLKEVCALVQRFPAHDRFWSVMRCSTCGTDWAIPYQIELTLKEVVE